MYLDYQISFRSPDADSYLKEPQIKIYTINCDDERKNIETVHYDGGLPLLLREICFNYDDDSIVKRSYDLFPDITAGDWGVIQAALLNEIYIELSSSPAYCWRMKAEFPHIYIVFLEKIIFLKDQNLKELKQPSLVMDFILKVLSLIQHSVRVP